MNIVYLLEWWWPRVLVINVICATRAVASFWRRAIAGNNTKLLLNKYTKTSWLLPLLNAKIWKVWRLPPRRKNLVSLSLCFLENTMTRTMNRINIIKTRSTATITTTTATVSQPKEAGAGILTRSGAALQVLSETSEEKRTRTVCWKDTGLLTNHAVHEEASLLSTQVDESQRIAKWDAFIAFLEAHGPSVVKTQGQLGVIQKWAEKTMRYKAYDPTSRSKEQKHRVCSYTALTWSFDDDMELQPNVAAVFHEMESCVSSTSPFEDTWSNTGDLHPAFVIALWYLWMILM